MPSEKRQNGDGYDKFRILKKGENLEIKAGNGHTAGVPQGNELSECACSLFDNGKGKCYRYVSAIAYIARVLGYLARTATGKVTSVHGGWAETRLDGCTMLVCGSL